MSTTLRIPFRIAVGLGVWILFYFAFPLVVTFAKRETADALADFVIRKSLDLKA